MGLLDPLLDLTCSLLETLSETLISTRCSSLPFFSFLVDLAEKLHSQFCAFLAALNKGNDKQTRGAAHRRDLRWMFRCSICELQRVLRAQGTDPFDPPNISCWTIRFLLCLCELFVVVVAGT